MTFHKYRKEKKHRKRYFAASFIFLLFTVVSFHTCSLKTALPAFLPDKDRFTAIRRFYLARSFNPALPHLNTAVPVFPANADLKLKAASYIAVDAYSGTVLLDKNSSKKIPAASLTKLVAIYTAMRIADTGGADLKTRINPPTSSWASNIPKGSSLMFLNKNQTVSIEELILGMSVVSGNDAAIALAEACCGSVKNFTHRMNEEMRTLGLTETVFVEPSGLDARNVTTAKEFAIFSLAYMKRYPENIKKFHSVKTFTYPKNHNMITPQHSITQSATNTLLERLEGCDGLKTGFIYESGFNIALTAERNGSRFLAVILGGLGSGSEGKRIREENGCKIINWCFKNFVSVKIEPAKLLPGFLHVLGASCSPFQAALQPICASTDFSQSFLTGFANEKIILETQVVLPSRLTAPITAGAEIGFIEYRIKDTGIVIKKITVIADRTINKGHFIRRILDRISAPLV